MWRRLSVFAMGVLAIAPSALAQNPSPLSGFYVGLNGGAIWIADQSADADVNGINDLADVDIEHDWGYQFAGQLGYQVQPNIRLEAEVSYSTADAERELNVGNINIDVDQELSILSGTAGIFLDLWPIGPIVPYIGGGVGYAKVEVEGDNNLGDAKQNVFMAFGEAGVPYNLTPELSIAPSVRFNWYRTEEESDQILSNGVVLIENVVIADNLYSTQFRLGLKYAF
ncbi:MAG: outer membrane protein [Geminicoccaceae bacterium]|jgi:opacity protein-like surface antigen